MPLRKARANVGEDLSRCNSALGEAEPEREEERCATASEPRSESQESDQAGNAAIGFCPVAGTPNVRTGETNPLVFLRLSHAPSQWQPKAVENLTRDQIESRKEKAVRFVR